MQCNKCFLRDKIRLGRRRERFADSKTSSGLIQVEWLWSGLQFDISHCKQWPNGDLIRFFSVDQMVYFPQCDL